MISAKTSTMSKIWVCSECGIAWDKEELDAVEHKNWCEDKYLVSHIPVSAVIEMIKERIQPKFHDDSDKLREHKNKLNQELESLKKQIEGE